jgi:hypothetical protein
MLRLAVVVVGVAVSAALAEPAHALVAFASGRHLGRLAMWSLNRDVACPDRPHLYADPSCSSIAQPAYAFATALDRYAG